MNVFFWNFVLSAVAIICGVQCVRADEALDNVEERFRFLSTQRQVYRLKFIARPDAERFQVSRVPSAKWPKRETFFLRAGEKSRDEQFRIKSVVEKQWTNKLGIIVMVSELEIVYLPDQTLHTLVQGVEQDIPTRFAELAVAGEERRRFYVKEGDSFESGEFPGVQFTLVKVTDDGAVIKARKGGGMGKEFSVSKEVNR